MLLACSLFCSPIVDGRPVCVVRGTLYICRGCFLGGYVKSRWPAIIEDGRWSLLVSVRCTVNDRRQSQVVTSTARGKLHWKTSEILFCLRVPLSSCVLQHPSRLLSCPLCVGVLQSQLRKKGMELLWLWDAFWKSTGCNQKHSANYWNELTIPNLGF